MPTPPYRQIAAELRHRITTGELAPGDRVPSENAIVSEYGVAAETARKALGVLAAEGLTEARRGSGTRVRAFRPILRRGTKRLAQSGWGEGRSIWEFDLDGRPLRADRVTVEPDAPSPAHVAVALGLAVGDPVCIRDRRYLVDDEPVMLATSYLPTALVVGSPITQPDTGPGGTYARLAELGCAPVHFREVVRSRMPLPEEAEALALGVGTPVVLIVRYAYAAEGLPVEVNEMVLDASRYLMEWEFPA
ncbi:MULTISPECIES: GntR family transcriptional regulator [unclassified Kitasatospora]|uniref:GntR family transcriptional regulator n=1 Tax=unclassified Kitasatospora TaxID=2633591 RepID=UPI00070CFC72|nr:MULTISPECIES: GntR family transcriptional regulator [unclassified Kitasatospora]KQV05638.1 GntR family transcriptional regulator [Kitasatospora sp. Root107]KRB62442.1 GntR family transcriptional regulator [Kitasatospora sp. Root187]